MVGRHRDRWRPDHVVSNDVEFVPPCSYPFLFLLVSVYLMSYTVAESVPAPVVSV